MFLKFIWNAKSTKREKPPKNLKRESLVQEIISYMGKLMRNKKGCNAGEANTHLGLSQLRASSNH